jgi:ribosomal protein S18 acetylase RimI-like enzyme
LRLGVAISNTAALTFWRKLGYRETGEVKPPQPGIVADVHVFEKPLHRGHTA